MIRYNENYRILKILVIICAFFIFTSCSSNYMDKSLKTSSFFVDESKVKTTQELPHSELTGTYAGIEDMYDDSDYVVTGVVKDIEYFENDKYVLLRKINVLVNKSYKGSIKENTLISILENDGYLRLKSLYEAAKKAYEEKNGNNETEDAWLQNLVYSVSKEDIKNDMLIRYIYTDKVDSKIDDKLLLFMTDSSDDTYKDKKVKFAIGDKLTYPKGAYASLGLGMGKFTNVDGFYIRTESYYTTVTPDQYHKLHAIDRMYAVKEMGDMLNKLNRK